MPYSGAHRFSTAKLGALKAVNFYSRQIATKLNLSLPENSTWRWQKAFFAKKFNLSLLRDSTIIYHETHLLFTIKVNYYLPWNSTIIYHKTN